MKLGTTHGILGYYTETNMGRQINSQIPEKFFTHAKSGDALFDSWRKATVAVYSGQRVGKVINNSSSGHYELYGTNESNISAAVRFKTLDQLFDDHLPGYGPILPDGDPNNDTSYPVKWDCGSERGW
jgi:hypothetical protein